MYQLKGFISFPALDSNVPGVVPPFGVLSDDSRTYAKTKGNFAKPDTYPNTEMTTFTLKNSGGSPVVPSSTFTNTLLALGEWVYGQYSTLQIPLNSNKAAFITSIAGEFTAFSNITIGQILTGSQPSQLMPDYIAFQFSDSANLYQVKLWFADAGGFATQYDDYHIEVIPPYSDLSIFQSNSASLGAAIATVSPQNIVDQISLKIGTTPQTSIQTLTLSAHDVHATTSVTATAWTAVIWGVGGTDTNAIKSAILGYISANSSDTNWNVIYPQLYAQYEFTVIPLWRDIAAPSTSIDTGIYSPLANVGSLASIATSYLPSSYAQAVSLPTYLSSNLTIGVCAFRSMAFLTVGNPNNASSLFKLEVQYPDYIDVPTTDPDFTRMQVTTQQFVIQLLDCLNHASTYQTTDPVPSPYTKVIYNSLVYLAFTKNGYTYNVLTNASFTG